MPKVRHMFKWIAEWVSEIWNSSETARTENFLLQLQRQLILSTWNNPSVFTRIDYILTQKQEINLECLQNNLTISTSKHQETAKPKTLFPQKKTKTKKNLNIGYTVVLCFTIIQDKYPKYPSICHLIISKLFF